MTIKYSFTVLSLCILLTNCIRKDINDDYVEPRIRILNPLISIALSESYQFNTTYFNTIGQEDEAVVIWSSSNEAVATISSSGVLTAISLGVTDISAAVNIENNMPIEETISIEITENTTLIALIEKSGIIMTTSSYLLEGSFTLSEQENSKDLLLSLNSNYQASTSLPGLYLYLSNNPNSISGAYNAGPVTVFNGAHTYTITDTGINDYAYLLYWCKPFVVKVGDGKILD